MRSPLLVDATDLGHWADRRDAQALLPDLVRRLVLGTVNRLQRTSFRAGEGVQLEGWDGIVWAEQGNAFVPDGVSGWEVGSGRDPLEKANDDYQKRTSNPCGLTPPETVFVFVTPRRWPGKHDWARARQSEGVWREVRAYDGDDLEALLFLAPAVHLWLSSQLGKHPPDAQDIESLWVDWAAETQPATPVDVVLAGRGSVVRSIAEWLRASDAQLSLEAESREEAFAVFAAALHKLPEEAREAVLSRAAVVRSETSLRWVSGSKVSLILVLDLDSRVGIGQAVASGHRVVTLLGRSHPSGPGTLVIPRISRKEAQQALMAVGIPESRARDLAALAQRSLLAFRRKLAVSPGLQRPAWARPEHGRSLLPALLAGAWSGGSQGDREAVEQLAGVPYGELEAVMARWANEPDPPVRRVGEVWYLVSREDAWVLLARYLMRDDLERFAEVTLAVLGTPDPQYELPPEKRWQASVLGHASPWSGLFRRGIAETLAVMGAREATMEEGHISLPSQYSTRVVHELLNRADADWRVWASLAPVLPLLAEADPDAFLEAVDRGLGGDPPILLELFRQDGDPLFSSSPHTGLLWALETLAWSPHYLGYAARLLAGLSRIDPGGKLANRPIASLREIFLLWDPKTAATLDQRLHVLDALRKREPEVTWRLLLSLLPKHYDSASPTATPRWQGWNPEEPPSVTMGEMLKGSEDIASRLLEDAGENASRWAELIEAFPSMPAVQLNIAIERLGTLDVGELQEQDRSTIYNALRELVSKHRSFAEAEWALPRDYVDRLARLLERFEPADPVHRFRSLFGHEPTLLEGEPEDWKESQGLLQRERLDAAEVTYRQGGIDAVLGLARSVELPALVGAALGCSGVAVDNDDAILRVCLAADDTAVAEFARGFAMGRISAAGREWAEDKLSSVAAGWTPRQRADLLACLPPDAQTWLLAEGQGRETEEAYWKLISPYSITESEAAAAVEKLLQHGRPWAAVTLVGHYPSVPLSLAMRALEALLQTPAEPDRPDSLVWHHVAEILDRLSDSADVDKARLARLEWAFLPALSFQRPPKILHQELQTNPDFFVEIVRIVFRAEGEEPREVSEEEGARARWGYKLLESWRGLPGLREDGTVDPEALRAWVRRARQLLRESGRADIGDQRIGQMLSGSPIGDDGIWPHPAVRDLVEEVASESLETGMAIGLHNSRGVVTKSLYEGGVQERRIAERYESYAKAVSAAWPRTAAVLRRMAQRYEWEAEREDQEARLREDLEP